MENMNKYLAILVSLILYTSGSYAQSQDIKLTFVGDIMLDDLPGKYIKRGKDPFASFAPLFKQSDKTIGNLECVVGTTGKAEIKPYVLRANPRVLPLIKKYFSAVSLANNHTGDYGPQALSKMIDLLDGAGIAYFGAGKDIRSAHEPIIFNVKGKRIAILGYAIFLPRSFEALDDRPGTAWGEPDYIVADIKKAKEFYGADIVITYPHWGWEGDKVASPREELLARLMIDSGADAVVGGHPHVTQNIEIYKGKPIFYSLGNFVFDGFDTLDTTTGWVLEMIIKQGNKITWQIFEARLDKNGIPKNRGVIQRQE
jgi:poly-gamma-glutamate capsule biosynthesis protein CapA/YwtB (metallophosphatase superfamily)